MAMIEVFLAEPFAAIWSGKDPFVEAEKLEGEVFREVKTRRTFRFEVGERGYFAKIHRGVGCREIFKNLFQFKMPVLGAQNEYRAIRRCEKIGVDTMTVSAYGSRGLNPAAIRSFLITEELKNTVSLEDYCRDWAENPPPFPEKAALIETVGHMLGAMHRGGLNHRDCYICHFLLDRATAGTSEPKVYVIDLHRAQLRPETPFHYLVKDVAGIYFSAMDIGLSRRDLLRFVAAYSLKPLGFESAHRNHFWRAVRRVAHRLYRREHGRPAPADLP